MRQLLRWVVLLVASVTIGLAGALTASATPSGNVTFFLTQHDDFTPIAWTAHGALEDSGTWDRGVITFSGGKSPVFAGMIQTFETNDANTGSFRMNFQGLGYNATGVFTGTWQISQGTGIYAGLHGNGTWSEIDIPEPGNPGHLLFTFPCPGNIHFE
jgi:hypothetical protein